MKKKRKILAISLAAAMVVTSLPGNGGQHAKAAGDASRWIDWDAASITEGTVAGDTYSETKEYAGTQIPNETIGSLSGKIKANEDVIKTKLSATNVSDFTYDYAWSVKTPDGEETINGEISDSLNTFSIPDKYLNNDAPERTFLCKVTLSGVTKDSEASPTDPAADHASDAADFTLKYQFTYKYTGPSEETIASGKHKLEDFFIDDGGQNFQDRESDITYSSASQNTIEIEFFDIHTNWETDNPDYPFYDFSVSFQWTALSASGAEKTLDGEQGSEVSVPLKMDFGKGEKEPVSKYQCVETLKYGESVLKKIKATFTPAFSPIHISYPSAKETTVPSRLNGTQRLTVEASFENGSGSLTYQWYKIDKDGRESILENETADSMKVRVKDYDTSYKCVITPKMATSTGGVPAASLSRIFKFTSDAGYKLTNISSSFLSTGIGETKTISANAEVDNGFTLKYQWAKFIGWDTDTSEEKYEDLGDAGKAPSIQVTPVKRADFIPYRLTVTVEKDGSTIETHIYRFTLTEYVDLKEDTNQGTVTAEKGEDLSLYVKTEAISNYTQIKTWYKEIAQAKYTDKNWNSETQKYDYVFADPDFKEPENYSYTTEESNWNDETSDLEHSVVYYQLIASEGDGTTLKLAGKSGDSNVDIQGYYLCQVELYRPENGESTKFSSQDFHFRVVYNARMYAYAKNKNVKAAVGEAAQLEVIAGNKNQTLYPITYKWEKRNDSTGDYATINGADGNPASAATLSIAKVSEADYGTYRATVNDGTTTEKILISLAKSLPAPVDFIAYTPEENLLVKAVGETAEMRVDVSAKQGTEPVTDLYYAWYRQERIYDDHGNAYRRDWELLGQEASSYSLTLADDRDYTTYKCVVTYKTTEDGLVVSRDRTFRFTVQKPFSFVLENLTPEVQYKKIGSPADFAVRIVTDDKDIQEKATYQWYRLDKDYEPVAIDQATSTSYHVDALTVDDFRGLFCTATYKDGAGKEYSEEQEFYINLYTRVTIKKRTETKKVTLGENVTLKPEIDNPDNETLTYQWYRIDPVQDKIDKLHGSTAETLVLNNIGTEEIVQYGCDIYCQEIVIGTYEVTLTDKNIAEEDALTISPADGQQREVKAVLGESAEFAVQAKSATGLDLKYQWFHSTNGYDGFDPDEMQAIAGATEASYKIEKVNPTHYGQYFCQVMDSEGNYSYISFELQKSTGLHVVNDAYYLDDAIGYEATFGGSVTLNTTATCAESYTPLYQWYYDGKKLYDETKASLTLDKITEDMLGHYYCEISDVKGNSVTQNFYVYVDTGLTVIPGSRDIIASGNTAKMFVNATAKEAITYQWSKFKTVKKGDADYDPSLDEWDEGEYEIYVDIKDATSASYSISNIKTEDYGEYRCVVATKGEKKAYYFYLLPQYDLVASRQFANQGDDLSLTVATENAASNADYTYTWYVQQPSTETFIKTDCTAASYQTKAPKVLSSDIRNGYCSVGYKCVIKDKKAASKDEETVANITEYVNILPPVTYETEKLPETNHPFDTEYDLKGYQIKNAKELNVTFDAKTALDEDETLYVIDSAGNYTDYGIRDFNGKEKTITVSGDRAIFLINGNDKTKSYGYKVASIKDANANPPVNVNPSVPKGPSKKKVPAKGKKYTTGNVTYKVTKSAAKNGTVTVSGVKTKKIKSATIKDTVKINGYTFKVTAIAAKAFKGCSKLKSVTIGKNVKTIGANAFAGDKKLKKIKIKGSALKSIGKKAFSKVPKSAKATVPKKKKKAYKKLLKKGKFTGKVK